MTQTITHKQRRIEQLNQKIAELVGYKDRVATTLQPVRDLVAHIAEFLCRFLDDGDKLAFGRKTLHCVKLYSRGWGKKFLFLYDTWGDKVPPNVPVINHEGFSDNNPDAPKTTSPTEADLQWIAENIALIIRRFAQEVDRKGRVWQEFVRDFYIHFLIANPVVRRIHEQATAQAARRWIKSPDLANLVGQYWDQVDRYSFQEFPGEVTTGHIYRKKETWAVVVSYCEGPPDGFMPLQSSSVAFGGSEQEMRNLMFGKIFAPPPEFDLV